MQQLLSEIASNAVVAVALPYPPSVNAMYFNAASGRVSSQAYQKWRRECGKLLKNLSGTIEGEYRALILVNRKRENADIDNRIKACLDILVKNKVTGDDSNCKGVTAEWLPKASDCQVYVYVFITTDSYLAALNLFLSIQPLAHTTHILERKKHKPDFKLNLNLKLTKENQNGLLTTH